jgi:hypothetical protein
MAGIALVAGLAVQAGCAPLPATRTVSTERITTTTPPPPPVISTEAVTAPTYYDNGRGMMTAHRSSAWDDGDVQEETTESIAPAVAMPQRVTTTRTITRTIGGY